MALSGRRSTAILLAVLLTISSLVISCAASSAPTTPTAVPTPALDASGQPILKPVGAAAKVNEFTGWKETITKVGRAKTISPPGLVALDAKGVWLLLHMNVASDGKTIGSFPRQNLSVKDSAGREYKLDTTATEHYSIDAKLASQTAPKGTTQMAAVFDVDPAATGLKLVAGGQETPIQE